MSLKSPASHSAPLPLRRRQPSLLVPPDDSSHSLHLHSRLFFSFPLLARWLLLSQILAASAFSLRLLLYPNSITGYTSCPLTACPLLHRSRTDWSVVATNTAFSASALYPHPDCPSHPPCDQRCDNYFPPPSCHRPRTRFVKITRQIPAPSTPLTSFPLPI